MTELTTTPPDGLDDLYITKLWSLLPEVYRAQDGLDADPTTPDAVGPLQELLARIAVQVAAVRRSIDRLWEDQSIETCDSWAIPYIAALLDTNLVPAMDARQQRLDVANTIYYRRRKGTVALLEQLAADVTGYECHVVEFFRRLGRTRHSLDPAIEAPAQSPDPAGVRRLQRAESLIGQLTGTPAGGYADLRNRLGANATGGAYDEYHHRADVRMSHGATGWYGIPKLGFFLWRVIPFEVDRATPVAVTGCDGHFTFDPTGRQIPLFQRADRGPNDYGENWQSLAPWQLPAPLTDQMWAALAAVGSGTSQAYPDPDAAVWPASLSVSPLDADPLPVHQLRVWPEMGRFAITGAASPIEVGYHYGLFGAVGAGPFVRRRLGSQPASYPPPVVTDRGQTSTSLADALTALGGIGTVIIDDGLTRGALAAVGAPGAPIVDVAVCAADNNRAVIRPASGADPWICQGATTADQKPSRLRLEGILLSGTDLVLRGTFEEVVLNCCTIDPGTAGNLRTPSTAWDVSVDQRQLAPSRIWVEGTVRSLVLDRCIVGSVRTRRGGVVETLTAADSVLQGLPAVLGPTLTSDSVFDDDALFTALKYGQQSQRDPLSQWLATQLGQSASDAVRGHVDGAAVSAADLAAVVADLGALISGPLLWTADRFGDRELRTSTKAAVAAQPADPTELALLNRQLLAEAYPLALADAAVATGQGLVDLHRCTLLGAGYLHRLQCSESILDEVVRVSNAQDGCVRFSAWSTDSALPRRYESVQVPAGSPIFLSRRFGEWAYGQVDDGADSAIVAATTAGAPSILTGSQNGSEMGAFCAADAAIKDRSLRIKLNEYMPVGLSAVLVHMPVPDADGESRRGRPWPT